MIDNEEYDGMRYPSIDKLLKKIDSKYKLAYVSAVRAREIDANNECLSIDAALCTKPIGQALEEILDDKIEVSFKEVK